MYNKTILMGRIANELELKTTPSGVATVSFRLAVDRKYQAKGEDKQTDFINIVAWRQTAEFICKYFGKGRLIHIDGELQTRTYKDKNDNTIYVTEVIADYVGFTGEKKQETTTELNSIPNLSQNYTNNSEKSEENSNGDYPF